jgi:hypothetical protein
MSYSRSSAGRLILTTPLHRITYSSLVVEVALSQVLTDTRCCGLCGGLSSSSGLLTAQQCLPRKPQGAALSFRLQQNCSALSPQQEEERSRQCTPVSTKEVGPMAFSFPDQLTECSRSRHTVVQLGDQQICLSRLPVLECGESHHGCVTRAVATKMVDFTCLPLQRQSRSGTTRLFMDRVARGESLPELR